MLEVKLLYFSFMSLGFPSAFLLFLLRKPKLKTQAKASGCQLLSGNKAFLVERSFHGAAKSLPAARATYYRSSRYRGIPAPRALRKKRKTWDRVI
jgi:hypothetical protein